MIGCRSPWLALLPYLLLPQLVPLLLLPRSTYAVRLGIRGSRFMLLGCMPGLLGGFSLKCRTVGIPPTLSPDNS